MKKQIVSKNFEVTPAIEEQIEKLISKAEKYDFFDDSAVCTVTLRSVKDDQIIEITIKGKNGTVRTEKRDRVLYNAISAAEESLTRSIRKMKERSIAKHRKPEDMPVEDTAAIIRKKVVKAELMSETEAINRMEAIDHDFFIYIDKEDGTSSVVYRRKDGGYGVISTEQ